jgi:hypothetical protein
MHPVASHSIILIEIEIENKEKYIIANENNTVVPEHLRHRHSKTQQKYI